VEKREMRGSKVSDFFELNEMEWRALHVLLLSGFMTHSHSHKVRCWSSEVQDLSGL
jgi:hypothetical protein